MNMSHSIRVFLETFSFTFVAGIVKKQGKGIFTDLRFASTADMDMTPMLAHDPGRNPQAKTRAS